MAYSQGGVIILVEIDENGGEYLGGYVPYEHPLKEKVFKYAKLACEYVPGLKGFIGIDFIIEDDYIYLLEINSRFTTSYVGLQKIININIAKTIIDLIDKKISVEDIGEITYSSKASFCKNDDGILEIKIEK